MIFGVFGGVDSHIKTYNEWVGRRGGEAVLGAMIRRYVACI